MSKLATAASPRPPAGGFSQFFSAAEARIDRWRELNRIARALSGAGAAPALQQAASAALAEIAPLEEFNGYPGPHLFARVHERLQAGDAVGFARLVARVSGALLANSYRDDVEAWSADDESEAHLPDILPPSLGRGQSRRPYFEVLIVAAGERSTWPALRESFRRLRRDEDPFVYEPVVVASYEDAILATLFNANLQSVVAIDGFAFESQFGQVALRELLSAHVPEAAPAPLADLATALCRLVHTLRPELDLFMVTDHDIGKLALVV